LKLAADNVNPEFVPEPFSMQYQRSLYQTLRNSLFRVNDALDREQARLPQSLGEEVLRFRQLQGPLLNEFRRFADRPIHAQRIRCHGDCHLHQVLSTGKDYVFIDFEGSSEQSIGERRIKRSPLRDVISMLRSFDYAAYATLLGLESRRGRAAGVIRQVDRPALEIWARSWRLWIHDAFLEGYFATCAHAAFLPDDPVERESLLRFLLTERLLSEIHCELRKRPDWVVIPIMGMLESHPECS
jgi:maltose alpha-D-glucosyltransferase/alpha-amylase